MTEKTGTNRGFTLVEVLAVMLIIGILAGITIKVSSYASYQNAVSKAKGEMSLIRNALEDDRVENNEYIETADFTRLATNAVGRANLVDPWGRAYEYRRPSNLQYDLFSKSIDPDDDGDDIR